ncbi:MAG: PD-(D/E)XK nuclease family protein [Alphaproteobacteria bacterium]|nr:PD-(D/E)XK nuclease family protein [Alphaproteobacteria bacterium]
MIFKTTFSDNLAESLTKRLLKEYQADPFGLAKVQVVVPTKRAAKIIKESFMPQKHDEALLLPQLIPLYELEALNPEIPPAIDSMERILLLAKLCQAKPNILTFDKAVQLAESLTELLDLSYQFDLQLAELEKLVPIERFAAHWQETIQFLNIINLHWPKILAERNQIDPADRKVRLIRAFTKRLSDIQSPVVLAGLDGAFPALQELLITASQDKKNWIILDGLVQENAPLSLGQSVRTLCEKLKVPNPVLLNDYQTKQETIAVQALAHVTWQPNIFKSDALEHVHLIVADTAQNEALTIALLLRQVLETPNKTAALVTTDRNLSRQVISQMQRWNILLDDSAGTPLVHTSVGIFLQLLTDFALHPDGPHAVALLYSPLAADGQNPTIFRQKVKQAEYEARKKKSKWSFDLKTDLTPFLSLFENNTLVPFKTFLTEHLKAAESLATSHDRSGKERLWGTDIGQTALDLFTELSTYAEIIGEIEPTTYPQLLNTFMQQTNVRPKYGMTQRLDILGPIEARLYHPDVCIIGGLNEGTFPPIPEAGPWLNCSMRKQLGIPLPEQKIDELALDFLHCLCASEVYLTRAQKVNGTPSIPSRFIERLKAVAEINNIPFVEHQAHLATLVNMPSQFKTIERPAPTPPLEVRPQGLSVTRIELWRRNPYAIYARYILKLIPLTPLEHSVKAAVFGSLVHKILELFFKNHPKSTNIQDLLLIGKQQFAEADLLEGDKVFLWPKFEKMANFIIQTQQKIVPLIDKVLSEINSEIQLTVDDKLFTLSGTADCIQLYKDGSTGIIDFKTQSAMPSVKEVMAGYAPQLPLEALLAQQDAFKTGPHPISDLAYWALSGKEDGGKVVSIQKTTDQLKKIIEEARIGLIELIHTFNNSQTSYEVCPIPSQAPEYDDYEHLARSQEWNTNFQEEA